MLTLVFCLGSAVMAQSPPVKDPKDPAHLKAKGAVNTPTKSEFLAWPGEGKEGARFDATGATSPFADLSAAKPGDRGRASAHNAALLRNACLALESDKTKPSDLLKYFGEKFAKSESRWPTDEEAKRDDGYLFAMKQTFEERLLETFLTSSVGKVEKTSKPPPKTKIGPPYFTDAAGDTVDAELTVLSDWANLRARKTGLLGKEPSSYFAKATAGRVLRIVKEERRDTDNKDLIDALAAVEGGKATGPQIRRLRNALSQRIAQMDTTAKIGDAATRRALYAGLVYLLEQAQEENLFVPTGFFAPQLETPHDPPFDNLGCAGILDRGAALAKAEAARLKRLKANGRGAYDALVDACPRLPSKTRELLTQLDETLLRIAAARVKEASYFDPKVAQSETARTCMLLRDEHDLDSLTSGIVIGTNLDLSGKQLRLESLQEAVGVRKGDVHDVTAAKELTGLADKLAGDPKGLHAGSVAQLYRLLATPPKKVAEDKEAARTSKVAFSPIPNDGDRKSKLAIVDKNATRLLDLCRIVTRAAATGRTSDILDAVGSGYTTPQLSLSLKADVAAERVRQQLLQDFAKQDRNVTLWSPTDKDSNKTFSPTSAYLLDLIDQDAGHPGNAKRTADLLWKMLEPYTPGYTRYPGRLALKKLAKEGDVGKLDARERQALRLELQKEFKRYRDGAGRNRFISPALPADDYDHLLSALLVLLDRATAPKDYVLDRRIGPICSMGVTSTEYAEGRQNDHDDAIRKAREALADACRWKSASNNDPKALDGLSDVDPSRLLDADQLALLTGVIQSATANACEILRRRFKREARALDGKEEIDRNFQEFVYELRGFFSKAPYERFAPLLARLAGLPEEAVGLEPPKGVSFTGLPGVDAVFVGGSVKPVVPKRPKGDDWYKLMARLEVLTRSEDSVQAHSAAALQTILEQPAHTPVGFRHTPRELFPSKTFAKEDPVLRPDNAADAESDLANLARTLNAFHAIGHGDLAREPKIDLRELSQPEIGRLRDRAKKALKGLDDPSTAKGDELVQELLRLPKPELAKMRAHLETWAKLEPVGSDKSSRDTGFARLEDLSPGKIDGPIPGFKGAVEKLRAGMKSDTELVDKWITLLQKPDLLWSQLSEPDAAGLATWLATQGLKPKAGDEAKRMTRAEIDKAIDLVLAQHLRQLAMARKAYDRLVALAEISEGLLPYSSAIDKGLVPFESLQSVRSTYWETVGGWHLGRTGDKKPDHEKAFYRRLAALGGPLLHVPVKDVRFQEPAVSTLLANGDSRLDPKLVRSLETWALTAKPPDNATEDEKNDFLDAQIIALHLADSYAYMSSHLDQSWEKERVSRAFPPGRKHRLEKTFLNATAASDDFLDGRKQELTLELRKLTETCGDKYSDILIAATRQLFSLPPSYLRYLAAVASGKSTHRQDLGDPPRILSGGQCAHLVDAAAALSVNDPSFLDITDRAYSFDPAFLENGERAKLLDTVLQDLIPRLSTDLPPQQALKKLLGDPESKVLLGLFGAALGYPEPGKLSALVAALAGKKSEEFDAAFKKDDATGRLLRELFLWRGLRQSDRDALGFHIANAGLPAATARLALLSSSLWATAAKNGDPDEKTERGVLRPPLDGLPIDELVDLAVHAPTRLGDHLKDLADNWDNPARKFADLLPFGGAFVREALAQAGLDPAHNATSRVKATHRSRVVAILEDEDDPDETPSPGKISAKRRKALETNAERLRLLLATLDDPNLTIADYVRILDQGGLYEQLTGKSFRSHLEEKFPNVFKRFVGPLTSEQWLDYLVEKKFLTDAERKEMRRRMEADRPQLFEPKPPQAFYGTEFMRLDASMHWSFWSTHGGKTIYELALAGHHAEFLVGLPDQPAAVPLEPLEWRPKDLVAELMRSPLDKIPFLTRNVEGRAVAGGKELKESLAALIRGEKLRIEHTLAGGVAVDPPKKITDIDREKAADRKLAGSAEEPVPKATIDGSLDADPAVATRNLELTNALLTDPYTTDWRDKNAKEIAKHVEARMDSLRQQIALHEALLNQTTGADTHSPNPLNKRLQQTLDAELREFEILKRHLYANTNRSNAPNAPPGCGVDDPPAPAGKLTVRRTISVRDPAAVHSSSGDRSVDKDLKENPPIDVEIAFTLPYNWATLNGAEPWKGALKELENDAGRLAAARSVLDKDNPWGEKNPKKWRFLKDLFRHRVGGKPMSPQLAADVLLLMASEVNQPGWLEGHGEWTDIKYFVNATVDSVFNTDDNAPRARVFRMNRKHIANYGIDRFFAGYLAGAQSAAETPTVAAPRLALALDANDPYAKAMKARGYPMSFDLEALKKEFEGAKKPTNEQINTYRVLTSALPFDSHARRFWWMKTLPASAQAYAGKDRDTYLFGRRFPKFPSSICMDLWARRERINSEKQFEAIVEGTYLQTLKRLNVEGLDDDTAYNPLYTVEHWIESVTKSKTPEQRAATEVPGPRLARLFRHSDFPRTNVQHRKELASARAHLTSDLEELRRWKGYRYQKSLPIELEDIVDLEATQRAFDSLKLLPWTPIRAKIIADVSHLLETARKKREAAKTATPELQARFDKESPKAREAFAKLITHPRYARWIESLEALVGKLRIAVESGNIDVINAMRALIPAWANALEGEESAYVGEAQLAEFKEAIRHARDVLVSALSMYVDTGEGEIAQALERMRAEADPIGLERDLYGGGRSTELRAVGRGLSPQQRKLLDWAHGLMNNHGLSEDAAWAKLDQLLQKGIEDVDHEILKGSNGNGERLFSKDFHGTAPGTPPDAANACKYTIESGNRAAARKPRAPMASYESFLSDCVDSDMAGWDKHSEYASGDVRRFQSYDYQDPSKKVRYGLPSASRTALNELPDVAQNALRFIIDRNTTRFFGRCELLSQEAVDEFKLPRSRKALMKKDEIAKLLLNPSAQTIFNAIWRNDELRREYLDYLQGKEPRPPKPVLPAVAAAGDLNDIMANALVWNELPMHVQAMWRILKDDGVNRELFTGIPAVDEIIAKIRVFKGDLIPEPIRKIMLAQVTGAVRDVVDNWNNPPRPMSDDDFSKQLKAHMNGRQESSWISLGRGGVKPKYVSTDFDDMGTDDRDRMMKMVANRLTDYFKYQEETIDKMFQDGEDPALIRSYIDHGVAATPAELDDVPQIIARIPDEDILKSAPDWRKSYEKYFDEKNGPVGPQVAARLRGILYAGVASDNVLKGLLLGKMNSHQRALLDRFERKEREARTKGLARVPAGKKPAELPDFENPSIADLRAHLENYGSGKYTPEQLKKLQTVAHKHLSDVALGKKKKGPDTDLYILLASLNDDVGRAADYGFHCTERASERYTVNGAVNDLENTGRVDLPTPPAPDPKLLVGPPLPPKRGPGAGPGPGPAPVAGPPQPPVRIVPAATVERWSNRLNGASTKEARLAALPSETDLNKRLDRIPASLRDHVVKDMRRRAVEADPSKRAYAGSADFLALIRSGNKGKTIPREWKVAYGDFLRAKSSEKLEILKQVFGPEEGTKKHAYLVEVEGTDYAVFRQLEGLDKLEPLLFDAMASSAHGLAALPSGWMKGNGYDYTGEANAPKRRALEAYISFLQDRFQSFQQHVNEEHEELIDVTARRLVPPPNWRKTIETLGPLEAQMLERLEQVLLHEMPNTGARKTHLIFDELLLNPERNKLLGALRLYDPEYVQLVLMEQEPLRLAALLRKQLREAALKAGTDRNARAAVDVLVPATRFKEFEYYARLSLLRDQQAKVEGKLVAESELDAEKKRALKQMDETGVGAGGNLNGPQLQKAYGEFREAWQKAQGETDAKKRDTQLSLLQRSKPFLYYMLTLETGLRNDASDELLRNDFQAPAALKPGSFELLLRKDWPAGKEPEGLADWRKYPEAEKLSESLTALLGMPSPKHEPSAYYTTKKEGDATTLTLSTAPGTTEHLKTLSKALARNRLSPRGKEGVGACVAGGSADALPKAADKIATDWIASLDKNIKAGVDLNANCAKVMREHREKRKEREAPESKTYSKAKWELRRAIKRVREWTATVEDLRRSLALAVTDREVVELGADTREIRSPRQAKMRSLGADEREVEKKKVEALLAKAEAELKAATRALDAHAQTAEKALIRLQTITSWEEQLEAKTESDCFTTADRSKFVPALELAVMTDEAAAQSIASGQDGLGAFLPPGLNSGARIEAAKKYLANPNHAAVRFDTALGEAGLGDEANAIIAAKQTVRTYAELKRTARRLALRAAKSKAENPSYDWRKDPLAQAWLAETARLCGSMGKMLHDEFDKIYKESADKALADKKSLKDFLEHMRTTYNAEWNGRALNWDRIEWFKGKNAKQIREDLERMSELVRRGTLDTVTDDRLAALKGFGGTNLWDELTTQVETAWMLEGMPTGWFPFNRNTAVRVVEKVDAITGKRHIEFEFTDLREQQAKVRAVVGLINAEMANHVELYRNYREDKDQSFWNVWLKEGGRFLRRKENYNGSEEALWKAHRATLEPLLEKLRSFGPMSGDVGQPGAQDLADHFELQHKNELIVDDDYLQQQMYDDEYARNVQYVEIAATVALMLIPGGQIAAATTASRLVRAGIAVVNTITKAASVAQKVLRFAQIPQSMIFHYGVTQGWQGVNAHLLGNGKGPAFGATAGEAHKTEFLFALQGRLVSPFKAAAGTIPWGTRMTNVTSNVAAFYGASTLTTAGYDYLHEGRTAWGSAVKGHSEGLKMAPMGLAPAGQFLAPLFFAGYDVGMTAYSYYLDDSDEGKSIRANARENGHDFLDLAKERLRSNALMYAHVWAGGREATRLKRFEREVTSVLDKKLPPEEMRAELERVCREHGAATLKNHGSLWDQLPHLSFDPKSYVENKSLGKLSKEEFDALALQKGREALAGILANKTTRQLNELLKNDVFADMLAQSLWESLPVTKTGERLHRGKPISEFTGQDLRDAVSEYHNWRPENAAKRVFDIRRSTPAADLLAKIFDHLPGVKAGSSASKPKLPPLPKTADVKADLEAKKKSGPDAARSAALDLVKRLAADNVTPEGRELLPVAMEALEGTGAEKHAALAMRLLMRSASWRNALLDVPRDRLQSALRAYLKAGVTAPKELMTQVLDFARNGLEHRRPEYARQARASIETMLDVMQERRLAAEKAGQETVAADILDTQKAIDTAWRQSAQRFYGEIRDPSLPGKRLEPSWLGSPLGALQARGALPADFAKSGLGKSSTFGPVDKADGPVLLGWENQNPAKPRVMTSEIAPNGQITTEIVLDAADAATAAEVQRMLGKVVPGAKATAVTDGKRILIRIEPETGEKAPIGDALRKQNGAVLTYLHGILAR